MQTILLTVGVMAFLMLAMAIGVIVQRKELKGSCGGVAGICACENAGRPRDCFPDGATTSGNFTAPGQVVGLRRQ